jgi:tetratricopeptide (TPR) repeat protein
MLVTQPSRRLSRRRRRVLWTAAVVGAALFIGSLFLVRAYRARQAQAYKPGEANSDITESLSRDLPHDAPRPVFVDVTKDAGLAGFVTFAGNRGSELPEDMGSGAAWGDVDNDGDDDLFVVGAGGPLAAPEAQLAPSILYMNDGAGHFTASAQFPETRIHGMAAAWGDYDTDGWIDLVVTGYNTLRLYHNDRGTLARDQRFPDAKGFWSGVSWGDYDRDGKLDLYVCGYVKYVPAKPGERRTSQQYGTAVPYTLNPASFEPERNLLFHNLGRGAFAEIGVKTGVSNPDGRSLSAVWHDFDDDGWPDLYVANDISDNAFYHNVNGRFEDISHPAWVADYRGAMGLAVGDWNRDGDDDIFITHWIAQENALYDSMFRDTRQLRFTDAADTFGLGQIALPVVGWGTEFLDFDSDGWLDLIAANGSTFETEHSPKTLVAQLPFLLWNRHGEYFHDLAPLSPPLAQPHVSRGLAASDYDNDGDLDVVMVQAGEGIQLLRNDTAHGHWAELVLRRAAASKEGSPSLARGALVVAHAGNITLRRTLDNGSYLSQSTPVVHFGLGSVTQIDRIEVRWPDGTIAAYGPLAAERRWQIVQGSAAATELLTRTAVGAMSERDRVLAFWDRQRAGMQALKVDGNPEAAAGLFRQALALDPNHEDARYYLASSLAAQGRTEEALAEYATLTRLNPRSHRGLTAWGTLRAITARSDSDLAAAERALESAHQLNPEETGALLVLGEVALLRGSRTTAEQRLKAACQTNARSVGGLFLLGYIAWTRGDTASAHARLASARAALGPDWKPRGATAEGDVKAGRLSDSSTPLSRYWEQWDGTITAPTVYRALDTRLRSR